MQSLCVYVCFLKGMQSSCSLDLNPDPQSGMERVVVGLARAWEEVQMCSGMQVFVIPFPKTLLKIPSIKIAQA